MPFPCPKAHLRRDMAELSAGIRRVAGLQMHQDHSNEVWSTSPGSDWRRLYRVRREWRLPWYHLYQLATGRHRETLRSCGTLILNPANKFETRNRRMLIHRCSLHQNLPRPNVRHDHRTTQSNRLLHRTIRQQSHWVWPWKIPGRCLGLKQVCCHRPRTGKARKKHCPSHGEKYTSTLLGDGADSQF